MEMKPLNIFQRVMRVWEEAHPYNAAQIMHLAGKPDLPKLTDTWNRVLATSGLGAARVNGRKFCYETPPRQEVTPVYTSLPLDALITREMNRPFSEPGTKVNSRTPCTTLPFRPFVLPSDNSYYLPVFYQHWVADSVSLRMLLREWFCLLHDPARATGKPLHIPKGGFWHYFGPRHGGWNLAGGSLALLRSTRQFSRARRIESVGGEQHVDCSVHRLPDGMIDDLLTTARARKVTINDLILAAMAKACDAHGAAPRRSPQDLALGTIVDLRPNSPENLDATFSLFLGFTGVIVKAGLLEDRTRLLENIAAQNAQQKLRRAGQVSMLRMAVGYTQAKFLSPQKLAAFYRNFMPLSGGVSNVNMNRSWAADHHPTPLLDYMRVAPTGPMVPLVIGVTTIGRRFSFVLTRRASLVDANRGKQLALAFIDELTAWAQPG